MIWNPWKRIRELERENDILCDRLEYEREEVDRRIGNAIYSHYQRIRHEDMSRTHQIEFLLKNQSALSELNFFDASRLRAVDTQGENK